MDELAHVLLWYSPQSYLSYTFMGMVFAVDGEVFNGGRWSGSVVVRIVLQTAVATALTESLDSELMNGRSHAESKEES